MSQNKNIGSGLKNFFQGMVLKKQYIKILKNKVNLLDTIKRQNYKNLNNNLFLKKNKNFTKKNNLITYIVDISFSRTNSLLHIMSPTGKLKFFCSAGNLSYKGKSKKIRRLVLKSMLGLVTKKLQFLWNQSIALHLRNVKFSKRWIIRNLKKKIQIEIIKNFDLYPYNGCRKRKVRRKKFKKKQQEEMAERFKAPDCKSVENSHRRFKSCFLHSEIWRNW